MKTRYIVAHRVKEQYRNAGAPARRYNSYPTRALAEAQYDLLKGLTVFRVLSYGFGNCLRQQGRDRDA